MASGRSSWLQRNIFYKIPFLYKICPDGNYHKAWDRLCFCRQGVYSKNWHGGIYDFKNGSEYQCYELCEECVKPEEIKDSAYGIFTIQTSL